MPENLDQGKPASKWETHNIDTLVSLLAYHI
jgi:hypothetical protein